MIKTSEVITGLNNEALAMLPGLMECNMEDILFLDIETTGLSPRNSERHRILLQQARRTGNCSSLSIRLQIPMPKRIMSLPISYNAHTMRIPL